MNGSELNQDSKPLPARLPSAALFARLAAIGSLLAATHNGGTSRAVFLHLA
jgi:hypothetical protein